MLYFRCVVMVLLFDCRVVLGQRLVLLEGVFGIIRLLMFNCGWKLWVFLCWVQVFRFQCMWLLLQLSLIEFMFCCWLLLDRLVLLLVQSVFMWMFYFCCLLKWWLRLVFNLNCELERQVVVMLEIGFLCVCLGIRLIVLFMLLVGFMLYISVFGFLSILMCLIMEMGMCVSGIMLYRLLKVMLLVDMVKL